MIVGRKIETSLTSRRDYDAGGFLVTKSAVVSELHATKGWRTIARHKEQQRRDRSPSWIEVKDNTATVYERRK
jgi:hypothetical protein